MARATAVGTLRAISWSDSAANVRRQRALDEVRQRDLLADFVSPVSGGLCQQVHLFPRHYYKGFLAWIGMCFAAGVFS